MAKKAKSKKVEGAYTQLGVRVEGYDIAIDESINHNAQSPQYALGDFEDDPLYRHVTILTVVGTSTYPAERAGHYYEVTIYGDDAPSHGTGKTLRDVQVRDRFGVPKYRSYRGGQIPVYNPPLGLGLINKVRGQQAWEVWVTLSLAPVTDMLVILGQQRQLYLSIREYKVDRRRWVNSLSLQSTDPAEE